MIRFVRERFERAADWLAVRRGRVRVRELAAPENEDGLTRYFLVAHPLQPELKHSHGYWRAIPRMWDEHPTRPKPAGEHSDIVLVVSAVSIDETGPGRVRVTVGYDWKPQEAFRVHEERKSLSRQNGNEAAAGRVWGD